MRWRERGLVVCGLRLPYLWVINILLDYVLKDVIRIDLRELSVHRFEVKRVEVDGTLSVTYVAEVQYPPRCMRYCLWFLTHERTDSQTVQRYCPSLVLFITRTRLPYRASWYLCGLQVGHRLIAIRRPPAW